jgi:tetratricopeptide (TPR) repeat protein
MTKDELFALMEQIAEEREAARPIAEKLASGEEPIDDIEIPEGWRTAGMVLELCERATPLSATDALRAVAMQQFAIAITTGIGSSCGEFVSRWLSGYARAEIGYSQVEQGWYDAAFRSFESARENFDSQSAAVYDQAKVSIRRAAALAFVRRCDEAFSMAAAAEKLFADFGDRRRVLTAKFTKGLADAFRNNFVGARSDFEGLIDEAEAMEYDDFLARIYVCLGVVCRELGDLSAAAMYYERGRVRAGRIANSAIIRKIDWGIARVLLAKGDFTKAEPMLRDLRASFLLLQLPEDAGLAALDIVEVLVGTNRLPEARILVEQVADEFSKANLNFQLLTAIGYLRDLLSATQHVKEAVRHVRSYAEKLMSEPALLFVPLEN